MSHRKNSRILLFYHQRLVAEGMMVAFSTHPAFETGHLVALDPRTILKELEETKADLLVMELAYISRRILEMVRKIRQRFPDQKILVVSGMISNHYLHLLMQIVNGYVLRTCDLEILLRAAGEVLATGRYLCPPLMEEIIEHKGKHPVREALTSRENEILLSWFSLNSTAEIARKLYISQPTVRTHLKNIREKFGKPSLMKMLFYACQETQFNSDDEPTCPYCKSFCTINTQRKEN